MNSPTDPPRSLAAKASWASLGLALGGVGGCFFLQLLNLIVRFESNERGVLVSFLPRTTLYVLWAAEALAIVVGLVSFLLIRRHDIAAKAVIGIVVKSLCGIVVGLIGTVVLWLIVGHIVIGF